MIARACVLLAIVATVAGCSASPAGPPGTPTPSAGSSTGASSGRPSASPPLAAGGASPSAPAPSVTAAPTAAPTNPGKIRPSGGFIRVGNFYKDAVGHQLTIDVYGGFASDAGAPQLVSVPYGTMTGFFDPGVIDDNGDAEISFFPSGKHGEEDAFGTQAEILKGGERFTIFLATSSTVDAAGVPGIAIDATFETGVLYPLPTAPTGQSVLIVDAIPLHTLPGAPDNLAYVAVGKECLTTLDELGGGGPQPIGGGSKASFAVPSGSQKLSFHSDPFNCADASLYPAVSYELAAGKRAYVVLYSLDDKEIRSLLVPIEP